jgi:hypothetical protein
MRRSSLINDALGTMTAVDGFVEERSDSCGEIDYGAVLSRRYWFTCECPHSGAQCSHIVRQGWLRAFGIRLMVTTQLHAQENVTASYAVTLMRHFWIRGAMAGYGASALVRGAPDRLESTQRGQT